MLWIILRVINMSQISVCICFKFMVRYSENSLDMKLRQNKSEPYSDANFNVAPTQTINKPAHEIMVLIT